MSTMVEESRTTGSKYHLRAHTAGSMQGSNAVAPAGGCVLLVRCITIKAMAVESEAASHWRRGVALVSRSKPKMVATMMPTRALKK